MKTTIAIISFLTLGAGALHAQRARTAAQEEYAFDVAQRDFARASADSSKAQLMAQAGMAGDVPFFDAPGRRIESALVIADESWPEEKLKEAREDGAIMMRLLQGALRDIRGDSPEAWAMGIHLESLGTGRQSRVLYLDGFGVLFQLHANMPLVAPTVAKSKVETKAVEDSAWERARRDLYGRPGRPQPPGSRREMAYSAETVERLKSSLIDALGSAANLRQVKDDEFIVVTVTGSSSVAGQWVERFDSGDDVEVRRESKVVAEGPDTFAWVGGGQLDRSPSTMTLKVKKLDAESFASKKISREEFGKRVKVVAY